jgi:hypothetical protein
MAVTIAATQITGGDPPFSQVVVQGMTDGDEFVVEGTADIHSWLVQGGMGVSDGEQLVLVDTRVPWGGPVTYRVTIGAASYDASPLTVTYDGPGVCVFQSLDGSQVVPVEVATFTDPKTFRTRRAFFTVSGRRDEPMRHDKVGLPERPLQVETSGNASADLERLLVSGAPIVRRQALGQRDIAPVQIISVGDFSLELVGAVGDLRVWSLPTKEMGLPEPGTVLFIFEWDDFDAVYAALTWDQFDAEWAGKTWDQFDATDWVAML